MTITRVTSAHERPAEPAVAHSVPVLISEQEVLLHHEYRRRVYPPRSTYLDSSRMSREMRRL